MTRTFVTGGTGLLGRHLTERLLARGGEVILLVREGRLADHAERLASLQALARDKAATLSPKTFQWIRRAGSPGA